MKYLIMESKTSYCVVLDSHGRFIKAANFGYQPGDRVDSITPLETDTSSPSRKNLRWGYSLAALAAALVLVVAGLWRQQATTVYGKVYFAVNPHVHMELNKKNRVLSLVGDNPDGEQLVSSVDFHKKEITQVTTELINAAANQNFLSADDTVTLAIDSTHTHWEQELGVQLRQQTAAISEEKGIDLRIVHYEDESSLAPPETPVPPQADTRETAPPETPSSDNQQPAASAPTPAEPVPEPENTPTQDITLEQAKSIALAHAGVSASNATFTKAKPDTEDGVPVYELDFETSSAEYEYEVTRKDGRIHSSKVEQKEQPTPTAGITSQQALHIALSHAGASQSEIHDLDIDFDSDDNTYEVEFDWGDKEYEYEIHGTTGQVLDYEIDD